MDSWSQAPPSRFPQAREIVPNVNRISATIRAVGGLNVFIRYLIDDAAIVQWSTWFTYFATPERCKAMNETFCRGCHGFELWRELDVQAKDSIVDKTRFGAFVPGSSDLHDILEARGIDTLIITGTATNVCCESTARDAMQMNYKVIFVADAMRRTPTRSITRLSIIWCAYSPRDDDGGTPRIPPIVIGRARGGRIDIASEALSVSRRLLLVFCPAAKRGSARDHHGDVSFPADEERNIAKRPGGTTVCRRALEPLEHFSIRLGVARVCEISFAFFFGNPFEKRGDCSPKLLNSARLHFA